VVFTDFSKRKRSLVHRSRPALEALEDRLLLSGSGVGVMTYNLNEGTDFLPLLAIASPQDVPAAVSATYQQVVASNIPERALGLAQVIAKDQPAVAGLQESAQYAVNGTVTYDLLTSLLTDLAVMGQHYGIVAFAPTFAAQAPDAQGDIIGFQDENVIIARTDLPSAQLTLTNPQESLFTAHASLNIGGTSLALTRSWASVDVTSQGQTFRFVNAHLEDFDPNVRTAQAQELLAGPANTALPVVLSGDFNSPAAPLGPDSGAYSAILAGGFTDTWSQAHPGAPGYTWGDGDPSDPNRPLTERIDLIFVRGGVSVADVTRAGGDATDRTGGFWPSDHDAVAGTVQFSAVDVSGQLRVSQTGLVHHPGSNVYTQKLTLTNTGRDLAGPFQIVLNGLPSGATLQAASLIDPGTGQVVPLAITTTADGAPVINVTGSVLTELAHNRHLRLSLTFQITDFSKPLDYTIQTFDDAPQHNCSETSGES
jgi:endonuclease/exonuclease/phosphatase family metal-dependent hydrolase